MMLESIEKMRRWVKRLYTPNSGELKVEGLDIVDEIEIEIEEHYMMLPVDVDGEPVHVGDKLTNINKPSDEYIVAGVNEESLFVYGGAGHIHASQCRHVKPRTLEDVLVDMLETAVGYSDAHTEVSLVAVERYANEIRELMEAFND